MPGLWPLIPRNQIQVSHPADQSSMQTIPGLGLTELTSDLTLSTQIWPSCAEGVFWETNLHLQILAAKQQRSPLLSFFFSGLWRGGGICTSFQQLQFNPWNEETQQVSDIQKSQLCEILWSHQPLFLPQRASFAALMQKSTNRIEHRMDPIPLHWMRQDALRQPSGIWTNITLFGEIVQQKSNGPAGIAHWTWDQPSEAVQWTNTALCCELFNNWPFTYGSGSGTCQAKSQHNHCLQTGKP